MTSNDKSSPISLSKSLQSRSIIMYLLLIFITIIHLSLIPGFYFAIQIGRAQFVGLLMYIVLSLAILDFAILFQIWRNRENIIYRYPHDVPTIDGRIIASLIAISISIVTVTGTGLIFYFSISIVIILVFIRILCDDNSKIGIILNFFFITLISFCLIAARTLTVYFPADSSDSITHTAIANNIVYYESLSSFSGTRYWGYFIFHILSAMGVQITALPTRTLISVFTGILFQVVLLSVGAVVIKWCSSIRSALLVSALLGFNVQFLTWGSKAHYQSLSFVFMSVFILIIVLHLKDRRMILPGLIVAFAWLMTHHISVLMFLTIIVPTIVISITLGSMNINKVSLLLGLIFTILFLVHWSLTTGTIITPLNWLLFRSPISQGISSTMFIETHEIGEELLQESISVFLSYLHLSIILAFFVIGLLVALDNCSEHKKRWIPILFSGMLAAVFYFPNPLWIPLEGALLIERWWIIMVPFAMILSSYGLQEIVNRDLNSMVSVILISVIMFLLIFASVSTGVGSPSLANIAGYEDGYQPYLTDKDREATTFANSYKETDQQISGTSLTAQYAFRQEWQYDTDVEEETYQRVRIDGPNGKVIYNPGLTIFQVNAYYQNSIMVNIESDQSDNIRTTGGNSNIYWEPDSENIVYTNGDTIIHYTSEQDSTRS